MKYKQEIEIDKPIDQVIALFDNPENMNKWMDGLLSFESVFGTLRQPDAKSKHKFKMGEPEIEMSETVTVRNLPDEFSGTYETKGVFNIVKNKFVKISDDKTKYIVESEFQFTGFMKFAAFLMPNTFKKRSMKYLVDFKEFVEKEK